MRRRSSGSAADSDDGDDNDSHTAVEGSYVNCEVQQRRTSCDTGRELTRSSSTLDRRKGDPIYAAPASQPPWNPPPPAVHGSSRRKEKSAVPLIHDSTIVVMSEPSMPQRSRHRSLWSCSPLTLVTTALSFIILLSIINSFVTRQLDPKGCRMSMMRPAFAKFSDFDTEHTRFASKYSLYLYREGGIDEDTMVSRFA